LAAVAVIPWIAALQLFPIEMNKFMIDDRITCRFWQLDPDLEPPREAGVARLPRDRSCGVHRDADSASR
jgi:hypothetical protein